MGGSWLLIQKVYGIFISFTVFAYNHIPAPIGMKIMPKIIKITIAVDESSTGV